MSVPVRSRAIDPGLLASLGSSIIWGMLPLYWHMLADTPARLILYHRIFWSCVFLLPLAILSGRMGEVVKAITSRKTLLTLALSSIILANNWLLFIWAVNTGNVLETSLGYYINPLITICFGVVLFRDRPSRLGWAAIITATFGVTAEVLITGIVPWIALGLAVLFAIYGLLRKITPVESMPGLLVETFILAPVALALIMWTNLTTTTHAWGETLPQTLLFMGTGIVTSVPLILYGYGARHLPFTTLGILQYLSPTCSFLIALFIFQEEFTPGRAISFTAIWIALAVYTFDSLRTRNLARKTAHKET